MKIKCVLSCLAGLSAALSLSAQTRPQTEPRLTVGGLNNAHEPLNYFTVYRSEGEYTILPSTWHDTGISLWGRARNVVEAILWHAYSKESDAYDSAEKFYNLNKEDRDAVVVFIESI